MDRSLCIILIVAVRIDSRSRPCYPYLRLGGHPQHLVGKPAWWRRSEEAADTGTYFETVNKYARSSRAPASISPLLQHTGPVVDFHFALQQAARGLSCRLRERGIIARLISLPEGHDPNSFFVGGGSLDRLTHHRFAAGRPARLGNVPPKRCRDLGAPCSGLVQSIFSPPSRPSTFCFVVQPPTPRRWAKNALA